MLEASRTLSIGPGFNLGGGHSYPNIRAFMGLFSSEYPYMYDFIRILWACSPSVCFESGNMDH